MASDKPNRVKQILELALRVPRAERARHVADACAGDLELRREVESLLTHYEERSPRTDDPSPLSSPTTFSPLDAALTDDGVTGRPQRGAASSPDVAMSWGGFLLLEQLGRGGFGVVYRAWDAALKRDVALKIIDVRRLAHATEDAVLREGQMMARVRHRNVVTVFSAQRIGSEIGLAMDYIKGRTLATLVAEDGPLSAHEAALIGISLCDALSGVHRLGLVHRDLKASNVMRENGGRIVLMDFGAGREIGIDAEARHEILGTPIYMPPEVLLGARSTPVSDLYSLGVLLYNLVTNAYPVRGVRADELRMAHLGGERVPLGERRPELPSRFVDAVERALSPDPKDRFQSAVAFKRELSEAMPHLPPDSGGRRRRAAPKEAKPPSERVTPATAVASRAGMLQWFIVGLGATVAVCWVLGFLTTMEFNAVLGRTGAFASEGPLAYPVWGARALIAPVIWMSIMLLLVNIVALIARLFGRIVPPIRRGTSAAIELLRTHATRSSLNTPTAWVQTLLLAGVVALIVVTVTFRGLVDTFITPLDTQPASNLVVLNSDHEDFRAVYRRSLEAVILLLGAGMIRVRRSPGGETVKASALAGVAAVMLVALMLLIVPWRLMFQADFEEATLAGRRCFVLGEAADNVLLRCPDVSPGRNLSVARTDIRLQRTGQISNLFDAYAAKRVTK